MTSHVMNGSNFGVVKMPEKPLLNWTKTAQEGVLSAMLVLTPSHTLAERCVPIYCDSVGDNNQINVCHIELKMLLTSLAMSLEALAAFTDMASGVRS